MNYLKYLVEEIHTTVMATTDPDGLPVNCAVDLMDQDAGGVYFLTAKGKNLYDRLKQTGYVALTGLRGKDTMSCTAVSVRGKVREIGSAPLAGLFLKNPYMKEIYPTAESQKALTVFQIYEGRGEWFDLSKKPIERASFAFGIGSGQTLARGYEIGGSCTGCGACGSVCPQKCIDFSAVPAVIRQQNCLHCGNCVAICPQHAVVRRG